MPVTGVGRFHRWLTATQIAPAFQKHPSLRCAEVLVVPGRWGDDDELLQLLILYGTSNHVELDAAVEALACGTQDPNLPIGLTNHDLYAPIVAVPGEHRVPALAFCTPESFRGARRDPELDSYLVLEAFAVYASFGRVITGEVQCLRVDTMLGERIDRVA